MNVRQTVMVAVVAGLMLPRRLTPSSQPGTGRT
jgi:hypothetical protein